MKKVLAAAGAALVTLALVSCGTGQGPQNGKETKAESSVITPDQPSGSNDDDLYMAFLTSEGIYASRDTSVEVAHQVCDALDQGFSVAMLGMVAVDSGFTQEQAAAIIAAAIIIYCPWNEAKARG